MTVFFTSILSNYLGRALLLANSSALHHLDATFRIYLFDYENLDSRCLDNLLALVEPSCAQRINFFSSRDCLPHASMFDERYTVVEACTAVKPFIARRLLEVYEKVIYLDPDCYVYSPLYESDNTNASSSWSLQLTPHILAPAIKTPLSERIFLNFGVFNLGYFAIRPTRESLRFLDWWCTMVDFYGVNFTFSGNFVDQKPLDLAPSFIDNLDVVKSPGWNVAWWNIFCDGRQIEAGNFVSLNNCSSPLTFFHFSNLDLSGDGFVSRPLKSLRVSDERLKLSSYPLLLSLFEDYFDALDAINCDVNRIVSFSKTSVKLSARSELSRLVNAEFYRLLALSSGNNQSFCSYENFLKHNFVVKIFLLFRLASSCRLNILRNFFRSIKVLFRMNISPTLFDFTSSSK